MKRLVVIGLVLVLALAAAYLRYGPLETVRKIATSLPVELVSKIRPQLIPAISIRTAPPAPRVLRYPRPKWETDTTRHGILVSVATLQANDAGRHKINTNRLNYLTTGRDFIAIADLSSNHVVILSPDLTVRQKWPMVSGMASMLQAPVSLAAQGDEIAALDRDGTLVWWNSSGKRLGNLGIDGIVYDLDFLENGDFLVHQTKPFPFMLAQYSRDGRKVREFGALPAEDAEAAPLLHQGHLACGRSDRIALALINPYKLFFFSGEGAPQQALEIVPEFQVFEPFAEKLGPSKWRVLRQKVVYDVKWHGGTLYVLVSPDPERAAAWLELFSPDGEFLQRFYLTMNAIQLSFWKDDLILLGYDPRLKLERFRIEKMHR